jgi:hypothetical protein
MSTIDVGALLAFDVDGDAGVDPDNMTLWLNQPELGLPSKGQAFATLCCLDADKITRVLC